MFVSIIIIMALQQIIYFWQKPLQFDSIWGKFCNFNIALLHILRVKEKDAFFTAFLPPQ